MRPLIGTLHFLRCLLRIVSARLRELRIIIDGIGVEWIAILLFLDDLGDQLQYLVVIGPLVGDELAGDEHVVDVDLEGANSGEDDLLSRIPVHEQILLVLDLGVLDQLIGDGILDDYGVGYELLDLALDCMWGGVRSLNCSKYFHSECRAKAWWVSQFSQHSMMTISYSPF